jgi:hypothetical protein
MKKIAHSLRQIMAALSWLFHVFESLSEGRHSGTSKHGKTSRAAINPIQKEVTKSHGLEGSVFCKEEKHRYLDNVFHHGGTNLLQ